jgi:hypothetical protein
MLDEADSPRYIGTIAIPVGWRLASATQVQAYRRRMSIVIPDACTLPTASRPLRLAEFDTLFTTAVRAVETVSPTHARLRLTGAADLEDTVRDLTARETSCCSFFTFTVTAAGSGSVILDVQVPDRYVDVLASLADRAATVMAGEPE